MEGPNVNVPRVVEGSPPELVVYDREQVCPYMKEQTARLPLRLPSRPLTQVEFGQRLRQGESADTDTSTVVVAAAGNGTDVTDMPGMITEEYTPTKTQKRIGRRGDEELVLRVGAPAVDARRVYLYNEHKTARRLRDGQPPIDEDGYRDFLVATCCDTFEISYYHGDSLVGIAICDRSEDALSAVYCCYDPGVAHLSIGTYSILKQLQLCKQWGLHYLYLGLYISGCESMEYKARYLPHERLVDGTWRRYAGPE